jgi:hypothetical protein
VETTGVLSSAPAHNAPEQLPLSGETQSLLAIQEQQLRESCEDHDPDFKDELTNTQFEQITEAVRKGGFLDETEAPENLGQLEALLPMRAAKLNIETSTSEPRVFFRTIDKESIVLFDQTGSPLDEIIRLIVRKVNSWISNEGIKALNDRRELNALKRGVPKPADLAPGKLRLYFRPAAEADLNPLNLREELANISKDLYLWLGRDESNAKLGENSALCKNLWKDWVVHKIQTFLLRGKKARDFSAVKTALSGLRSAGWAERKNYVNNLRVIFGIINKYFFEAFMNQSYSAMQNSNFKLTAAKINGELGFKSHNIEVLTRCLTSDERLILTPWLTSKEAQALRTLTKQVFSEGKFRLLPKLGEASNAWDKSVSKAVIKILYKRNRERSLLQSREREESQRRARASGVRTSAAAVRQIAYDEVKKSFVDKKDYLPICTPLLEVCYKTPSLDFERAISFGNRAFSYFPPTDLWIVNPEILTQDEPLFEAFPNLRPLIESMTEKQQQEDPSDGTPLQLDTAAFVRPLPNIQGSALASSSSSQVPPIGGTGSRNALSTTRRKQIQGGRGR